VQTATEVPSDPPPGARRVARARAVPARDPDRGAPRVERALAVAGVPQGQSTPGSNLRASAVSSRCSRRWSC